MAYAMNFEVYKSMDALETATQLEPDHFCAHLLAPILCCFRLFP